MLQPMGSQRVGHDWETEQEQSQEYFFSKAIFKNSEKRHTDTKYRARDKYSMVVITKVLERIATLSDEFINQQKIKQQVT